jgi:hypothetical protein
MAIHEGQSGGRDAGLDPLDPKARCRHVSYWRRSALVAESLLPQEALRLPEELAPVDAVMDDQAYFVLVAPYFDPGLVMLPNRTSGIVGGRTFATYVSVAAVRRVGCAIHGGLARIDSTPYSNSISVPATYPGERDALTDSGPLNAASRSTAIR